MEYLVEMTIPNSNQQKKAIILKLDLEDSYLFLDCLKQMDNELEFRQMCDATPNALKRYTHARERIEWFRQYIQTHIPLLC